MDPSLATLPTTGPGGTDLATPSVSRQDTIDDSHLRGPARLKLKVQPPPPPYPYADSYFLLEVYLVDQLEALKKGEEVPLKVTLLHLVGNTPAEEGVLVMDPTTDPVISKAGNCTLRVKVMDDHSSMERRRFRIQVEAEGRADLEPVVTDKMTIIRNRLEIRENPDNPVPDQWYKDEGGRENCVELQVHLLDSSGREVKSRRVPLRLVLMYENMHRVHNQEILKLSPDSKLIIDEEGKATLRVRIEEVSKNHQRQAFRVKVEPDVQEQPSAVDISSVVSKPITVLSKRIKPHNRNKRTPINTSKRPAPAVSEPGYVASIGGQDRSLERRVNFTDLINPATPVDTKNVTLYEALKSVIEWTGQVVKGLQSVQWQLLGYELKADGNPDHDRPLYSMSNPNVIINNIVRRYANDTMHNLHVLLKRIEANGLDDPLNGGGGGSINVADHFSHHHSNHQQQHTNGPGGSASIIQPHPWDR
ncbi:unnamed protein product, partial [Discosporangium mesarthrocarpum]